MTEASDISVGLSIFEGPLDLLIFLVSKNEIDIYDIPIHKLTDEYIKALNANKPLNPEKAGHFFSMAATLMYIKSRMLLPASEREDSLDGENKQDPRWELVQQLLEYQSLKEASYVIKDLNRNYGVILPRQQASHKNQSGPTRLKTTDTIRIWRAFTQVLKKFSNSIRIGILEDEHTTIAGQIVFLLDKLKNRKSLDFYSLFQNAEKQWVVITTSFIAMLELARIKKIKVIQQAPRDRAECRLILKN